MADAEKKSKAVKTGIWVLVAIAFFAFIYFFGSNFLIVAGLALVFLAVVLAVLKPEWFSSILKWSGLLLILPAAIVAVTAIVGAAWLLPILLIIYIIFLFTINPKVGLIGMLLIIIGLMVFFTAGPEIIVRDDSFLGTALISQKESFLRTLESLKKLPGQTKGFYERELAIATGDIYTGKVDEKSKEQLGVYIENFKPAEERFYESAPVTVFANIKARTFDKPINLRINCSASNNIPASKIRPRSEYVIEFYDEQGVDCVFDPGVLEAGTYSVAMLADFDFKTMAYLKSYFMEQERLRAFRRQNIAPFQQYGITDTAPTAIYTQGPVRIGMRVESALPVGIDKELPEIGFILGVTLENAWQGKVTKVNNLTIIIPKGFVLTDISNRQTEKITCFDLPFEDQEGCDDSLVEVYMVSPEVKSIDKYVTFRANVVAKRQDYQKILGEAPISTKYFKTMVSYDYRLEGKTQLTVREINPT